MQSNMAWSRWAESLRRHNIDGLVAWFLEAGAPLTVIGAQVIYMTQPFIGGKDSNGIAQMLEDEKESTVFAHYLRDEVAI